MWISPLATATRSVSAGGLAHAQLQAAKAKRAIYLFMSGAPSQMDMYDYKPMMAKMFDKDLPDSVRRGQRLTSRETGVLAAIGEAIVQVWRRPKVAIISTGDEIIAPGQPMQPGLVYDSNARIVADAVTNGGDA